ncbi:MAG: SHOCT domain-containing protein [Oscillospiraceae bacterium]|nr:SHOCT domain-containing protein [Oscillospiraceae bacterium]
MYTHRVKSETISQKRSLRLTNTLYGDNADELKKYKELPDGGIITQEEFDAKKKQLSGL